MTKYIAEIGLNHMGDEDRAAALLTSAVNAGADGVTFQIQPPAYYDHSKPYRIPLSKGFYLRAAELAKKSGVKFGLAVNSLEVLNLHNFDLVDFWKILSTDFLNTDLIDAALSSEKYVYLSTGVSDIEDIKITSKVSPSANFIHTTLSLMVQDANVSALNTIKNTVANPVSFGLHSVDLRVAMVAMAFNPHSLFFYIKSEEALDFPDNEHAIPVQEIEGHVSSWDFVKSSLGDGLKTQKHIPDWVYD